VRTTARLVIRALLCVTLVTFIATGALAELPVASDVLTPAQILARYAAALAKLKTPKAMSFDYSVAQLGLRDMEQTHHVYRSALDERDETRIVDGYVLPRPTIRIIANRIYRYDLHAVAPTPAAYAFSYAGTQLDGDDVTYVFHTSPVGTRSFAVSDVVLDGKTFLPKTLRFKIASDVAHGSGELAYVPAEKYWVISEAQVSAHVAHGALAREHIRWSNYQFPSELPASTFAQPRAILAPEPDAAATATPAPPPGAP